MTATRQLARIFNIHENTPRNLYEQLNKEFDFTFDPCPEYGMFLSHWFGYDGLNISWKGNVYINPPYGKAIRSWLEKALEEIKNGCNVVVFLLPAYTDVKWFHEVVLPNADDIRFIKGRLKFGDHRDAAPFASMIVVFRKKS